VTFTVKTPHAAPLLAPALLGSLLPAGAVVRTRRA